MLRTEELCIILEMIACGKRITAYGEARRESIPTLEEPKEIEGGGNTEHKRRSGKERVVNEGPCKAWHVLQPPKENREQLSFNLEKSH